MTPELLHGASRRFERYAYRACAGDEGVHPVEHNFSHGNVSHGPAK
jgi:hypothetical protein